MAIFTYLTWASLGLMLVCVIPAGSPGNYCNRHSLLHGRSSVPNQRQLLHVQNTCSQVGPLSAYHSFVQAEQPQLFTCICDCSGPLYPQSYRPIGEIHRRTYLINSFLMNQHQCLTLSFKLLWQFQFRIIKSFGIVIQKSNIQIYYLQKIYSQDPQKCTCHFDPQYIL